MWCMCPQSLGVFVPLEQLPCDLDTQVLPPLGLDKAIMPIVAGKRSPCFNGQEPTAPWIARFSQQAPGPFGIISQADALRVARETGRHKTAGRRCRKIAQDDLAQRLAIDRVNKSLPHAHIVKWRARGIK